MISYFVWEIPQCHLQHWHHQGDTAYIYMIHMSVSCISHKRIGSFRGYKSSLDAPHCIYFTYSLHVCGCAIYLTALHVSPNLCGWLCFVMLCYLVPNRNTQNTFLWPLLLRWFNFNPSMDKQLHPFCSVWRNRLSIPNRQRCNRWTLGMDGLCHPTFNCAYDNLSILGLKLICISKRGRCVWILRVQCSFLHTA